MVRHSVTTVTGAVYPDKESYLYFSAEGDARVQTGKTTVGVPVSNEIQTAKDCDLSVVVMGRPQWTSAEIEAEARLGNDARALLNGYRKHEKGVLDSLTGNYILVIINERAKRALVAIDKLGINTLYYSASKGRFAFSTSLSELSDLTGETNLSSQALFNYVYFHVIPSPRTIYEDVEKLRPGECIEFKDGNASKHTYWYPSFSETAVPPEILKEELRDTLSGCVERAMTGSANVGAFLSGGLDSSTVCGLLSKAAAKRVSAYTIGFEAKGYDESDYARIAAERFGLDHHIYYVTPDDVLDALPIVVSGCDEPFGNSSALPAYFCARHARSDGIDLMLAGDGGDELFGGNERYAKQYIFELYQRLPESIRRGVVELGLRNLPGRDKAPIIRKFNSYVEQAKIPLPDRLQSYNYLHRIALSEVFEKEFLGEVDSEEPLAQLRGRYFEPDRASSLNRMLYLDWKFTLADNDLKKVGQMCRLGGVDVAYPMLDDRLVEFSCKVPSNQKIKGTQLRYFFKQAMQNLLPPQIINKSKHGFGLPFGVWMRSYKPLQEFAYDSVMHLGGRGVFNSKFLKDAIDLHRTGHAVYYGELIWVLMVLELWLSLAQRGSQITNKASHALQEHLHI